MSSALYEHSTFVHLLYEQQLLWWECTQSGLAPIRYVSLKYEIAHVLNDHSILDISKSVVKYSHRTANTIVPRQI